MGKLKDYARNSDLMKVHITFGKEVFEFHLGQEMIVDENVINKEIKEQPNSYAFLSMLHKKLLRVMMDAEREMEKRYSEVYNKYKEKINQSTGRVYDKDYAQHIANANPKYQEKKEIYIKAKADYETIGSAVKSFEQRAFLIQTLSANIRKES